MPIDTFIILLYSRIRRDGMVPFRKHLETFHKEDQAMRSVDDSDTKVTRVKLCGVQGCCPTVEIHHGSDRVVITDDDGGKVTLTKEQWREALVKVNVDA